MSRRKKGASAKKASPPRAGHASDRGCKGCRYHEPNGRGTCNFCYITGKPRGCPVEGCTRKEIGPPARLSSDIALPGSPREVQAARIRAPKKAEATAPPAHPWEQPKGGGASISRRKMWELYQKKMNDAEIAARLGCNPATAAKWRKLYNLPPWQRGGRRLEHERTELLQDMRSTDPVY